MIDVDAVINREVECVLFVKVLFSEERDRLQTIVDEINSLVLVDDFNLFTSVEESDSFALVEESNRIAATDKSNSSKQNYFDKCERLV